MTDIKHVFFDLDHTLWDFEKNSSEALTEVFIEMELNKKISGLDAFIQTYQKINAKYWNLYNHGKVTKAQVRTGRFIDTLESFGMKKVEDTATELAERYLASSPYKTHIFPDAHETLRYLKGKYQLHIITNGFTEVQHKKLKYCNLKQYFDLVLCTEEVGVNKPNPIVFNTAMSRTNAIASSSVMIGDNPETDIMGAKNCGLHTILFNPHMLDHAIESKQINGLKELINIL